MSGVGPLGAVHNANEVRINEGDFMFAAWMRLVMDTSMLTLESQQVIALRFLRLTLGGSAAAPREVNRMVAEKIGAIADSY